MEPPEQDPRSPTFPQNSAPKKQTPSWLNNAALSSAPRGAVEHPLMNPVGADTKLEDEPAVSPGGSHSASFAANRSRNPGIVAAGAVGVAVAVGHLWSEPPALAGLGNSAAGSAGARDDGALPPGGLSLPPELDRSPSSVAALEGASKAQVESSAALPSTSGQDGRPAAVQESPSSSRDKRVALFHAELSRKRIELSNLQSLAMQGIPDVDDLRATTWKLLLGCLPRRRDDWGAEAARKRAEYAKFREELIVNPSELARRKEEAEAQQREAEEEAAAEQRRGGDGGPEGLARRGISQDDHPLSLGPTSAWHRFFQDMEMVEQIDRDVKRTHPDMPFFNGDDAASLAHQDAMRRILFVFAKLNPGIRYVQGMNEVLAPLFYVLSHDASAAEHAEADAFFCFVSLLGDFRDNFCQQLDNSSVGIRATIQRLSSLLRAHDGQLWRHLEQIKINPQFYAFRWITLLLTQEFSFDDILRLWDALLSSPDGPMEILLRFCCAMLVCVRDRLLAGDFTTNLKLLQSYPRMDLTVLLRTAEHFK